MKLTKKQRLQIATSHQRQMSSVHPHAIIETIEDAIDEALSIANVSGRSELLKAFLKWYDLSPEENACKTHSALIRGFKAFNSH